MGLVSHRAGLVYEGRAAALLLQFELCVPTGRVLPDPVGRATLSGDTGRHDRPVPPQTPGRIPDRHLDGRDPSPSSKRNFIGGGRATGL